MERKKKSAMSKLFWKPLISTERNALAAKQKKVLVRPKNPSLFSERLNSTAAAIRLEYKVHLLAKKKKGGGEVGGVGEQIGLHVTLLVIK